MLERHTLELHPSVDIAFDERIPRNRPRNPTGVGLEVGHYYGMAERWKARSDLRHLLGAVHRPVPVVIAVDDEEHRRLNLCQSVEDSASPELRCTRRPDGTDARRRQHGYHCLGHVRQVGRDTVAAPNTEAE